VADISANVKIGIFGTDARAIAIARLLAEGGHDLTIGDPVDDGRANQAAAQLGIPAESGYRQAITREIVVFAFPWTELDAALAAVGSPVEPVVLDAITGAHPPNGRRGADLIAHRLDSHRVVRALIALPQKGANILICGDDADSKQLVSKAIESCGCLVTDRGPLSNELELEPPQKATSAA